MSETRVKRHRLEDIDVPRTKYSIVREDDLASLEAQLAAAERERDERQGIINTAAFLIETWLSAGKTGLVPKCASEGWLTIARRHVKQAEPTNQGA